MRGFKPWAELRGRILESIVPSDAEREVVGAFCIRTERELTERLRGAGLNAVAKVHGSVARDTWLSGERDIDVFIVLDEGYGRVVLPCVLDVVKGYVGEGWVEAYAEHPYIRAEVDGFDVEFVPCFRVDPKGGLISATDRSPLHTEFLRESLKREGRDEARLLKRFMKGLGVYGAEIKVGGFSGYLCDLLVAHYGSFESVLEGASAWRRGEVIDLVGGSDAEALRKRFLEPLIALDPVDPKRNTASAVSETVFWTFVAAVRAFLAEPSEGFFYPDVGRVDVSELIGGLEARGIDLLFVVAEDEDVDVPDVLWGQLYRTERALAGLLTDGGFTVFRSAVWSDESTRHVLVFELERAVLPAVVKRMGPPVRMARDGERFLRAHMGAEETVSGPWIEGDRWWVETRRRETEARELVNSALSEGGRDIGISRRLGEKIRRAHAVLVGGEIAPHLDSGFAGFLDRFLKGRPGWLD